MIYAREMMRRHYEYLEREHAKFSAEEAMRTRVEGQNALYLADLAYLLAADPEPENVEH